MQGRLLKRKTKIKMDYLRGSSSSFWAFVSFSAFFLFFSCVVAIVEDDNEVFVSAFFRFCLVLFLDFVDDDVGVVVTDIDADGCA